MQISFLSGQIDLEIMNSSFPVFSGVLPSPKPNIYDDEDPDLPKFSTNSAGFASASADWV